MPSPPIKRRTKKRSSALAKQPIELPPDQVLPPDNKVCGEAIKRLVSYVHEYSKAIHVLYLYVAELEEKLGLTHHKDWDETVREADDKTTRDFYMTMLSLSRSAPNTKKNGGRDARPWRPNGFYEEAEQWQKFLEESFSEV
jgi:hypothetical protein